MTDKLKQAVEQVLKHWDAKHMFATQIAVENMREALDNYKRGLDSKLVMAIAVIRELTNTQQSDDIEVTVDAVREAVKWNALPPGWRDTIQGSINELPYQHHLIPRLVELRNAAPTQKKHKPLFAEMIAQHPGLAEELAQQDTQVAPQGPEFTDAAQLLPCPFCGGEPERMKKSLDERFAYANEVTYWCKSCGCSRSARGDTSKPGYADNSTVEARALAAWNTRAAMAQQETQKKHKPLFAEMIAQHPGLAEELAQQDAQAVPQGEATVEEFSAWLNERRGMTVALVFHEVVAKFRAAVEQRELSEAFRTELDKVSQRNFELRMENASLKAAPTLPAEQDAQPTEQAKPASEADKLVYRSIAENYAKDTQKTSKTLHEELGVSEAELEDLRLYKSMVESHGLQIFGLARELKDRLSENPLPKLTKQQAVVLTGYTGVTCCNFGDFHEDLENRLGRPVFTHEIAMMPEEKIKELYREDFLKLCK